MSEEIIEFLKETNTFQEWLRQKYDDEKEASLCLRAK